MQLMTTAIRRKLLANHKKQSLDTKPVVKYFNPYGGGTWLISSMDKEGIMFGLCDLGFGLPELGYVSLYELQTAVTPMGVGIERDLYWDADKSLKEYSDIALECGYIKD